MINARMIKELKQARENRDPEEAKKVTGQLPEIPPLADGETMAVVIPKRGEVKKPS